MDPDRAEVALNIEASWSGLHMRSDLLLPGRRRRPYVIGDLQDASFPIDPDAMGGERAWTLVGSDGTIRVPPFAGVPAGEDRLVLARGESVSVSFGPYRFVIRASGPPPGLRLPVEFNRVAFCWSVGGVLACCLLAAALLVLRPEVPDGLRARLAVLEDGLVSLAGNVDTLLARRELWLPGPEAPPDSGPGLPCEPVSIIEAGPVSPGVSGGVPGTGHASRGGPGPGQSISWSSAGRADDGLEAGSLLGYGMCMLPGDDEPG
jgi:hypothetical protein